MLEVGNFQGPDNLTQGRTHFGAWCIVSAPLYLSFDLTNKSNVDAVWEIISNKEAIAVNQAWYGHPGRLVKDGGSYQLWAKKLADGAQAALVINRNGTAALHDVTVSLESLGTELGRGATAWDVWAKKPVPLTDTTWRVPPLQAYDSAFLIFKPLGVQEVITNIVL
jgi:alpha-galactosidase